jgi:patatin-like phospholipase/acyl hydrolase
MKKILTIDSGGIRGIIPAVVLAEIETRAGQPICDLFDFFAGTSAGGMLALGLNCPRSPGLGQPLCSASEVVRYFYDWGQRVFGNKLRSSEPPLTERKLSKPIDEVFCEYFGNTLLCDSIKPILITAFDLTTEQPFFFNSAKISRSSDAFMWQAARATTAIPTHFEPLRLPVSSSPFSHSRQVSLIDGSLFASNPAMCALAEAQALFPAEDDFLLVSLGCGEARRFQAGRDAQRKRPRILDFALTAQSDCVDRQLRSFLPKSRYIRIQTDLAPGLDRIDDASQRTLLRMEENARQTIVRHSEVLNRVVDLLSAPLELAAVA